MATDPTQYDPNDPRLLRVTTDTVHDHFERVTTNIATGGKGPLEPGWRCKHCAWTVAGIGLPLPHVCQAINPLPPRKVSILSLNLGLLVEMLKTQGPATFFVAKGLPPDAKAMGANIDAGTGTLQLIVTSETFAEVGAGENGQITLPAILPDIFFNQCAVVPVVEGEETEDGERTGGFFVA